MEKDLVSLFNLFNGKIFRIPDYQRGYSWKSSQLSEFWTDLLNVMQSGQKHYTGMLSLKELKKEEIQEWKDVSWMLASGAYKPYHLVDGQQRLTTIEILIKVILNFCKKEKYQDLNTMPIDEMESKYLRRCVLGNTKKYSYLFGYEIDEESDDYFKYYIMENPEAPELNESSYTQNMKEAKQFFENRIEEITKNKENKKEILDRLFSALTTKLIFNPYYIGEDFNPYLAFETMNNRGKPLSNLELLKNRLIYLTTLFPIDENIKKMTRKDIDKAWREIYKQIGRNKNNPLSDDEYLQIHWILYFGYNRSKASAYVHFLLKEYFVQQNIKGLTTFSEYALEEPLEIVEDYIQSEEEDIKRGKITIDELNQYVQSLQSLASKWYYVNNPEDIKDSDESIKKIKYYLERLKRLKAGYFRPLIVAIYNDETLSNEEKIDLLYWIERHQFFHFRIYGYNASYQNSVFYNFAHYLYTKEKPVDEYIKRLKEIDYMDNGVLKSSIVGSFSEKIFKNGGFYAWSTTSYVLYEYENYLKENKEITKIIADDYFKTESKMVTIEHIYPQTPTDSSWIKAFEDYSDEEKKRFNGSLGNLLPLAQKINSGLQNYSFQIKKEGIIKEKQTVRRGYKEGSYNEIRVATCNTWGPDEILQRGLNILSFMEQHWNFQFASEEDKKEFLGLSFMKKK